MCAAGCVSPRRSLGRGRPGQSSTGQQSRAELRRGRGVRLAGASRSPAGGRDRRAACRPMRSTSTSTRASSRSSCCASAPSTPPSSAPCAPRSRPISGRCRRSRSTKTATRSPAPRCCASCACSGQAGRTYVIAEGEAGRVPGRPARRARARPARRLPRRAGRPHRAAAAARAAGARRARAGRCAGRPKRRDDLRRLGFDLEPFGPRQLLVRAVPGVLSERQPQRVLQETLTRRRRQLARAATSSSTRAGPSGWRWSCRARRPSAPETCWPCRRWSRCCVGSAKPRCVARAPTAGRPPSCSATPSSNANSVAARSSSISDATAESGHPVWRDRRGVGSRHS